MGRGLKQPSRIYPAPENLVDHELALDITTNVLDNSP